MADWQNRLDLKDVWGKIEEGELSVRELAKITAERLKNLKLKHVTNDMEEVRDDIVDEFEGLSEDESAKISDFDSVMSRLYDWGDTDIASVDIVWPRKKVCWIATSF